MRGSIEEEVHPEAKKESPEVIPEKEDITEEAVVVDIPEEFQWVNLAEEVIMKEQATLGAKKGVDQGVNPEKDVLKEEEADLLVTNEITYHF